MTFNEADVRHYLNIVQDDNPHHPKIVPGQMVIERIWQSLHRYPLTYHVKYVKPIHLNESYKVEDYNTFILVKNTLDETMLKITLSF
ncbi:hypothetical protein [Staphylococcus agnetis]|uniref:hypothetical protein n=1 Tax=Staphylococcus agnetis TaxID=985762 RepID=UPI000D033804|nr:hypothetical protein [Staphylococcus agnetis]